MKTKRIKTMRRFETFDLHAEVWSMEECSDTQMEVYRNKRGDYLDVRHRGRRPGLIRIIARLNISPECVSRNHSVCSVGKSTKDGKWYGWSHRAMVGFGKGDRIFQARYTGAGKLCDACKGMDPCEGLPCPSSILFIQHGEKTIINDVEGRKAAVAFARYVG